ncbi:MAG: VWA domain-containing protein [Bacilli bacterium]|nr:VWA domain-containing protein [Bacilli bacterium]
MGKYATDDDLIYVTSTRIPVCLCIDTSGSMSGKDGTDKSRIERVKEGIEAFYQEVRNDELIVDAAEVSIVGFNDDPYIVRDFGLVKENDNGLKTQISASGQGNIGVGVLEALNLLAKRKEMYKENGVDYYQPWIIIMSDGHSTGDNDVRGNLKKAQEQTLELEKNGKLNVVTVYIGGSLNEDTKAQRDLGGFSKKNPTQEISATKFSDFFVWLGKSVSIVAEGNSDQVALDFTDLTDWTDF